MAEASESNYKIGDRVTATSPELNGQLGTIKYIGAVNPLLILYSFFINFPLSFLVKKEPGTALNLMYLIFFAIFYHSHRIASEDMMDLSKM